MGTRAVEISAATVTIAGLVCSAAMLAAFVASSPPADPLAGPERIAAAAVLRAEYADRQFDTSIASLAAAAPHISEFAQIAAIRSIELRTGRVPETEQAIGTALARARASASAPSKAATAAGAAAVVAAVNLASVLLVALAISGRRRERARIAARLEMPPDTAVSGDFASALLLALIKKGGLVHERGTSQSLPISRLPEIIEQVPAAARHSAIDDTDDGIGPTGVRARGR